MVDLDNVSLSFNFSCCAVGVLLICFKIYKIIIHLTSCHSIKFHSHLAGWGCCSLLLHSKQLNGEGGRKTQNKMNENEIGDCHLGSVLDSLCALFISSIHSIVGSVSRIVVTVPHKILFNTLREAHTHKYISSRNIFWPTHRHSNAKSIVSK